MTRMKWMLVVAALLLGVTPGFGQEGTIRRILRFQVKPGMMPDFVAAVKADKEAMEKVGHKRRQTWWQSTSGPAEVLLVRYYKSYADMEAGDGPLSTEITTARGRVNRLSDYQETVIDEIIPEATVVADAKAMPKYIRTLRSTVKPEKTQEYLAWVKNDIGPAVKKSNLKLYISSRVRYGATTNMFVSGMGLDSLATLDEGLPLVKVMGQQAYDAAMAKRASYLLHTEATLYRALPELNYFPPAK